MALTITIAPYVTEIDVSQEATTVVEAAVTIPSLFATGIKVTPYNTITSTNLQVALEQLADQSFRGSTTPNTNVEEGDTWYDTTTDIFYVYRTLNGVTDWHPLLATEVDSRLDGGAF